MALSKVYTFQSEYERYLAEKLVGGPVVLQNHPKDIKSFYMRMNDDGTTVTAMDILAPGIGEIIGDSQPKKSLDVLNGSMDEVGLVQEPHY